MDKTKVPTRGPVATTTVFWRCACGAVTRRIGSEENPPLPYKKCHACAAEMWRRGMVKQALTFPQRVVKAAALVGEGNSVEQAALSCDIHTQALFNYLHRNTTRPLNQARVEARSRKVHDLRERGYKTDEIAAELGLSRRTIRKYLSGGHVWLQ